MQSDGWDLAYWYEKNVTETFVVCIKAGWKTLRKFLLVQINHEESNLCHPSKLNMPRFITTGRMD